MAKILGVRVDDVSMGEALKTIEGWLTSFQKPVSSRLVFTPGPEFLVTAQKDEEFKKILNSADLSVPDGFGLQIFGGIKNRVPGVDLVRRLCGLAAKQGWTVGMLGNPNTRLAAKELQRMFPGLRIVFTYDNPQADAVLRDYDSLRYVDILFVGVGHPKQEKFLWACKLKIKNCKFRVGMGVGGSFDFISGQVWEPGKLLNSLGLKWFGRLLSKPGHILRVWRAVVVFPLLVFKEALHK